MRQFVDGQGREWSIQLSLWSCMLIEEKLQVDLCEIMRDPEFKILNRLLGDYLFIGRVLAFVCQDQCRERGVDERGFMEGLFGDALKAGKMALLDELISIAPSPINDMLTELVATNERTRDAAALEAISSLSAKDKAFFETLNDATRISTR